VKPLIYGGLYPGREGIEQIILS